VNRKITLIAAGVSLIMVLGWWFLMWSPAGADIEAADLRYQSSLAQAQDLDLQLQRLEATEARMPEMQSRFQTLTAAVPGSPDMADFTVAVDEASRSSGIDFLTVTASPPRGADATLGLSVVDVQITGAGGYFQMLDFVNRLQETHRVFVIDNLTVSAAPATSDELLDGPPGLNVTLAGRLFLTDVATATAEGA